MPHTEKYWIDFYGSVVLDKVQKQMMNYSKELNKFFEVSSYPVGENKFAVLFMDVTEKIQQNRNMKEAIKRIEKADKLKTQFFKRCEPSSKDSFKWNDGNDSVN